MHFEKTSKQFTEIPKKLGSKKTKAPIDLKPATTLENLFKRFLFILKPSVVHPYGTAWGVNTSILSEFQPNSFGRLSAFV